MELIAAASEIVGWPLTLVGATDRGESGSTVRLRGDGELILKVVADRPGALEDQYRLLRIVADLRERGSPVPEYLGAGQADGSVFTVQRVLPGELLEPSAGALPADAHLERVVPELLDAVDLQRDAGDLEAVPWPDWLLQTIEVGGDGYCIHETLQRRADTRQLLERLVTLAGRHARGTCRTADIVHFDLNPANVLHVDGHLSGIVDWNVPFEGAAQGDRGSDIATLLFYLYDHEPSRRSLSTAADEVSGRDWVIVYLCHLTLRQVEWSMRHRPGSAEEARFLRIGRAVLDDCEMS